MGESRIIGALSYPALHDAFTDELAAAPLNSSTWILVPTNLVAQHLLREAARALGGIAGPQFLVLMDAASRVAGPALTAGGMGPMPEGALELVLRDILRRLPSGSPFKAFQEFRNGPMAVGRAVRVLADCLWTPERLREAAADARFTDPAAPTRLNDLAGMWAGLDAWKAENRLFEPDDLVILAGRDGCEPARWPRSLFIYGFYDFNPAQRALLGRLIERAARCSAYLLWAGDAGGPLPGFGYAEPAVRWLQEKLEVEGVGRAREADDGSDLCRLRRDVFAETLLLSPKRAAQRLKAEPREWDGSVRIISCPGDGPEAEEAVREVLRAAAADEGPRTTGILLRGGEGVAGLLAEGLERVGIAYSMREGLPLAGSVAGRVALALVELAGPQARRADVIAFLGLARMDAPEELSASLLDRISRQASIICREHWRRRLTDRAEYLRAESSTDDDEDDCRRLAREADICVTAAGFLDGFFSEIDDCMNGATWAEMARRLAALVRRCAPEQDAATDQVLDLISGMARLDVVGTRPRPEQVRLLLARQLAGHSERRGRFLHAGVAVSGIMAARGTRFDVVVLPHMIEKSFPRRAPGASLLTEPDRRALNAAAGRQGWHPLPLQAARTGEERYLFRVALGSAGRSLVLLFPRIEQHSGRPRMPSRFLRDVCSALLGFSTTGDVMGKDAPAGLVTRVPLVRRVWPKEDKALALDALEYDGAVFGDAPDGARLAYLSAVSGWFKRAVAMENGRWGANRFGPYDGKVRAADLLEFLRKEHERRTEAVSPSRFEAYAGCPFAFFVQYVLGIERFDPPPEEVALPPSEFGLLVHRVLADVFERRLLGRSLGRLSDADIEDAMAWAADRLTSIGRVHAANHPATWAADSERVLAHLKATLLNDRDRHPDARPLHVEYAFGGADGEPEGCRLALGPDAALAFKGRIDRVDRLADGGIDIVDYKTGSARPFKKESLRGGRQVQLPIYLLAAAKLLGAGSGSARYFFSRAGKDMPQFALEDLRERGAEFRDTVRALLDGMLAGDFFPLPADTRHCEEWCDCANLCGAARKRLAEMKAGDPDAARLRTLRQ